MSQYAISLDARATLGEKLKAARLKFDVKPSQLAERAEVSRQTVYNVENGSESAPKRLLCVYAKACQLDLDLLLLSWGYVPDDIFGIMQRKPELCKAIRAGEVLRAELSFQS